MDEQKRTLSTAGAPPPSTVAWAWRQRGYNDAASRRIEYPPADAGNAAAYRDGYRTAQRQIGQGRP